MTSDKYHLVYYDAFGPRAQPDMWNERLFEHIYELLEQSAVFVTYCAKGDVRRALTAARFEVERLPGPPGKREMLRAFKR
jgi:tRNA U34 5-methylaminomethyl-2-thiouridine-forming methyltransferase MnmC